MSLDTLLLSNYLPHNKKYRYNCGIDATDFYRIILKVKKSVQKTNKENIMIKMDNLTLIIQRSKQRYVDHYLRKHNEDMKERCKQELIHNYFFYKPK